MKHLTDTGREIYHRLEAFVKGKLYMAEVDDIELSMLANSYDLYFRMARFCNLHGVTMSFSKKQVEEDIGQELADDEVDEIKIKAGGAYQQIRPEYTAMKNEYQNILKHSSKFGLTPGDRAKIFKDFGKEKEPTDPFAALNK
jgi:P27 family predicted phage terminase small subunit